MTCPVERSGYTAVIRTLCSFPQVDDVIRGLRNQSLPPELIVVVDSGSPQDERSRLQSLADIFVDYPPEPFNFSKAINLGVDAVTTPYCLIISSHFVIDDPSLVESCVSECRDRGVDVFYVSNVRRTGPRKFTEISPANFDGANGFSNACGFVPTALVRGRRFREEVFACEDQEWAAWYIREHRGVILKVGSPGIRYLNPRVNPTKKLNEELAIAAFVDRRRLSVWRILWRLVRAGGFVVTADLPRAAFERRLAEELWRARRRLPRRASRYF